MKSGIHLSPLWRVLVVICVRLALSAWVQAERLAIQTFTTANGLADNTINRIVRDSRGFLWFCTEEGLSRFDGYEFVNFGTDQGLPHPYVNDLLETHEGEYWIATNGGLVQFNFRGVAANEVTTQRATNNVPMFTTVVPADDDRRARAITTLFEDHAGSIWCGTLKGLYRLDRIDGVPVLTLVDIGIPGGHGEQQIVTAIVEDNNQTLWIATHQGLYRRWSDGSTARYTTQQGLPDNVLHHLLIDHEGQIWVSSRYAGFFVSRRTRVTRLHPSRSHWLRMIFRRRNGPASSSRPRITKCGQQPHEACWSALLMMAKNKAATVFTLQKMA